MKIWHNIFESQRVFARDFLWEFITTVMNRVRFVWIRDMSWSSLLASYNLIIFLDVMHLKYLTGVHKAPVEYSIIIKKFGIEVIVIPHEVELCVRMAIVSTLHEVIHLVAENVFRNVLESCAAAWIKGTHINSDGGKTTSRRQRTKSNDEIKCKIKNSDDIDGVNSKLYTTNVFRTLFHCSYINSFSFGCVLSIWCVSVT